MRLPSSIALAAAVLLSSVGSRAEEGDGAYGRLSGDVTLIGGVSGGLVPATSRKLLGADLRLRYLESAGMMLFYEEADFFGRATEGGQLHRAFGAGVELRPFFPARFLKGYESGRAFLDLLVDSLGLELCTYFSRVEGTAAQRPGLHLGLGIEVPLSLQSTGVWLRLGTAVRWTSPELEGEDARGGRVVAFTLGLAFHQVVPTGAVDVGDRHLASRRSGPSW